ncbi:MAG: YdcF family protein, partial [Dongiaceae bacterium]
MFILGKLVGWVASVEFLFALPLAIALVVLRSRPRLARSLLALLLLAVLALTFLPVGSLFLVPLEERFPRPAELPAEVAGIIVLGGSVNLPVSEDRRTVALNEAAERLTAAVALARHYP